MTKVSLLSDRDIENYNKFILRDKKTLIYYSNKYRLLLKQFLQAEDNYLIATDKNNNIVGILPSFVCFNPLLGNVLNSLPFYGSHGSILEFEGNHEVRAALLNRICELSFEKKCIASTIITTPFEENIECYDQILVDALHDRRIGQITSLPAISESLEVDLMASFHQKTRNMIRKAQKVGLTYSNLCTDELFSFLVDTHHENISSMNGLAKPKHFFDLLRENFELNKDYKLYTAFLEDKPIATLLLLYFNKTVEYFTPAIVAEYRTLQPLSFLIFQAMQDAIYEGYLYWNWGGTWLTQDGVYLFKKRWGTQDYPYNYYTKIYHSKLLNVSKQQLLEQYPYFYVLPFNKLNAS